MPVPEGLGKGGKRPLHGVHDRGPRIVGHSVTDQ